MGELLGSVCENVRERYVFAEVADRVVARLRRRAADGAYDGLAGAALGAAVTADLQSVNGDKHLRLRRPVPPTASDPDAGGVARVEVLPDGVGYLDTRCFPNPVAAGEAYRAAMSLLAGTSALLIDVRRNRGGEPESVAQLCGYLFDERTHLNDIWHRQGDRTEQLWSPGYVPDRRFGGTKPVAVLTSSSTFSGGEDLAYSLRQLGRATIVGERTRGGAHPCEAFEMPDGLELTVPVARSINPVSGTNWEAVGMAPDAEVPAAEALVVARTLVAERIGLEGGGAAAA